MDLHEEIIRDIYASAMEATPWTDAIAKMTRAIGATSSNTMAFLPPEQGGFWRCDNLPEDLVAKYASEVEVVDVWYHEILRRHGAPYAGLIYRSDELVQRSSLLKTRFHADYLGPSDIGCNLGLVVGTGEQSGLPQSAVSFYRPLGAPRFEESQAQLIANLQPHLTQSLRVRLSLAKQTSQYGALALEACPTPVLMLNKARRI